MIVVIGSSNTDLTVISNTHLPERGESVRGDFFMTMGGKGALQSVAASRLGQEVYLLSCVGNDEYGKNTLTALQSEKVHTDYIFTDRSLASGVAVIMMDARREKTEAIAAGANSALCPEHVFAAANLIRQADILLCELSIRLDTIMQAVKIASSGQTRVLMAPSPAQRLDQDFLKSIDVIIPNESEAEILTGIQINDMMGAEEAARALYQGGAGAAIITLGKRGSFLISGSDRYLLPARKVLAVDSSGAGDSYTAGLAVALAEGRTLRDAMSFATYASALTVTRRGAQSAFPYRDQLDVYFRRPVLT